MATATAAHDGLIRELYRKAARGPLKVGVGPTGYPPHLRPGEVARVERDRGAGARPGDFLAVDGEHGDVRLVRLLAQGDGAVQVFGPARIEAVPADAILGRVVAVERDGREVALDTRMSAAALAATSALSRLRAGKRRMRLTTSLAALYWHLAATFDRGVSETGDILITDKCPVGCTFCIYSCRPAGTDMTVDLVAKSAAEFRAAGIPKARLLGGEPFVSVPHLVDCFRAVRRSYDADDIIVLTSGYFGTSAERVRQKCDPLVAEGLRHLHLSFDTFHLERYPVSCYEQVLDYCRERRLTAALVVHYTADLASELGTLLRLRQRYPFAVRITTVSREGDATRLSESETSVAGFDEFRRQVLDEPGVELVSEDRSCFRWTAFPGGDVHFCCKQNDDNRVGNLERESFRTIRERLRDHGHRNRLNVLRFLAGHRGEVSGNACLTCPLRADSSG